MTESTTNTADANVRSANKGSSYVDVDTILRIKNLELRARVIVQGFMSGLHRSPYHGFSVEFTDYRQYSPGDDLRHLDWKLLARQDRMYIKRFEDETNLRCYLLTDLSQSMSFGAGSFTKSAYAKTVAATLAYFLTLQRDAVGVVTFDEAVADVLPPRFRPGHLRRLMMCLERSTGGKSTNLALPLEQIAQTVKKRGLIVLISDLLAETGGLKKHLSYLRSMGHDVIILRILDRAEVEFDFESASMFRDLETGKEIYVDPQTIGEDYRRRFNEHSASVQKTCDDLGIDLYQIMTDQPLETALFDLIQARARRGRSPSYSRQTSVRGSQSGGNA